MIDEYAGHLLFGSMAVTFLLGLWLRSWLRRRLARRREAFVSAMETRGYERLDAHAAGWTRVLALVLPGAEQGPREMRGESLGDPFRYVEDQFEFDALRSRDRPERVAGLVHYRARYLFPILVRRYRDIQSTNRSFLIGEAFPLPVPRRVLAWTNAPPPRPLDPDEALRRGFAIEPAPPDLADTPLLRAACDAVRQSPAIALIQVSLILGPRGWVVETEAWRSAERLSLMLPLADAIADAVRKASAGSGG